ncbi:hypothetical protein D3C79_921990 [compost metagenome]
MDVRVDQQHRQFLAAVAANPAVIPQQPVAELGHPLEHHVPGLVAIGVVDPLEVVQIQHGQTEGLVLKQQQTQPLIEEAPVVEAGQLVHVRLLAHLVVILAHLGKLGIDVS